MNKKLPKNTAPCQIRFSLLKWQFEIAPGYTVFTLMQTVLGDVDNAF